MSWESFDRWPGEASDGGAFRGRSEPVLAKREGATFRDRWVLFWSHSPDHDSKRAARRLMLTSNYLYVQRFDHWKGRVPVAKLRGCRRMDGRLLFGVEGGEDLILMHRPDDELQTELLKQAGGSGQPWSNTHYPQGAMVAAAFLFGVAVAQFRAHPFAVVRDRWESGLYTAETCLGFYAAVLSVIAIAVLLLWVPSRISVDRLGVERARGMSGLFTFYVPADQVKFVVTQRGRSGFESRLVFKDKVRIGTLGLTESVRVQRFSGAAGRNLTLRLSEQLRVLLGVPHRKLG